MGDLTEFSGLSISIHHYTGLSPPLSLGHTLFYCSGQDWLLHHDHSSLGSLCWTKSQLRLAWPWWPLVKEQGQTDKAVDHSERVGKTQIDNFRLVRSSLSLWISLVFFWFIILSLCNSGQSCNKLPWTKPVLANQRPPFGPFWAELCQAIFNAHLGLGYFDGWRHNIMYMMWRVSFPWIFRIGNPEQPFGWSFSWVLSTWIGSSVRDWRCTSSPESFCRNR